MKFSIYRASTDTIDLLNCTENDRWSFHEDERKAIELVEYKIKISLKNANKNETDVTTTIRMTMNTRLHIWYSILQY